MQESSSLKDPMAPSADDLVRLGGIDYLNALPLLWGLGETSDRLTLGYHVPSRLAQMLDCSELDRRGTSQQLHVNQTLSLLIS